MGENLGGDLPAFPTCPFENFKYQRSLFWKPAVLLRNQVQVKAGLVWFSVPLMAFLARPIFQ